MIVKASTPELAFFHKFHPRSIIPLHLIRPFARNRCTRACLASNWPTLPGAAALKAAHERAVVSVT